MTPFFKSFHLPSCKLSCSSNILTVIGCGQLILPLSKTPPLGRLTARRTLWWSWDYFVGGDVNVSGDWRSERSVDSRNNVHGQLTSWSFAKDLPGSNVLAVWFGCGILYLQCVREIVFADNSTCCIMLQASIDSRKLEGCCVHSTPTLRKDINKCKVIFWRAEIENIPSFDLLKISRRICQSVLSSWIVHEEVGFHPQRRRWCLSNFWGALLTFSHGARKLLVAILQQWSSWALRFPWKPLVWWMTCFHLVACVLHCDWIPFSNQNGEHQTFVPFVIIITW